MQEKNSIYLQYLLKLEQISNFINNYTKSCLSLKYLVLSLLSSLLSQLLVYILFSQNVGRCSPCPSIAVEVFVMESHFSIIFFNSFNLIKASSGVSLFKSMAFNSISRAEISLGVKSET